MIPDEQASPPKAMKLAFLIAAHAHPELLARIVKRLESPATSIHIHLDRRADFGSFRRVFAAQKIENVHWIPRCKCRWGSFDQVKVALRLLSSALKADPEAKMFLYISGQDYPLKTPAEMMARFEQKPESSFILYTPLPYSRWKENGGLERLSHYHFSVGSRRFEYPNEREGLRRLDQLLNFVLSFLLPKSRPLPPNLALYGGSQWWNLSRETAEKVLDYLRQNPSYFRLFHHTYAADEIFFQTLLVELKTVPLENDNLRQIFWDARSNHSPAVVDMTDFDEIQKSGALFTRKVHPETSAALLDEIDRVLLGRDQAEAGRSDFK
jgi:hypothetical protein